MTRQRYTNEIFSSDDSREPARRPEPLTAIGSGTQAQKANKREELWTNIIGCTLIGAVVVGISFLCYAALEQDKKDRRQRLQQQKQEIKEGKRWENFDANTQRLKVPGGWLIKTYQNKAWGNAIFISDPKHKWVNSDV